MEIGGELGGLDFLDDIANRWSRQVFKQLRRYWLL